MYLSPHLLFPRTPHNTTTVPVTPPTSPPIYPLIRKWNVPFLVGSYLIAVLGAYTATQLLCQASTTRRLRHKLGWVGLASFSLAGTAGVGMHWVKLFAMDIGIPFTFPLLPALVSGIAVILVTFLILAYPLLELEFKSRRSQHHRRGGRFSLSAERTTTTGGGDAGIGTGLRMLPVNPSDDELVPLLPVGAEENDPSPSPSPSPSAHLEKTTGTGVGKGAEDVDGAGGGTIRRRPTSASGRKAPDDPLVQTVLIPKFTYPSIRPYPFTPDPTPTPTETESGARDYVSARARGGEGHADRSDGGLGVAAEQRVEEVQGTGRDAIETQPVQPHTLPHQHHHAHLHLHIPARPSSPISGSVSGSLTLSAPSSRPGTPGTPTQSHSSNLTTTLSLTEHFLSRYDASALRATAARSERIARLPMGSTWVGRAVWGVWFGFTIPVLVKGSLLGLTVLTMHFSAMWTMRMDGFFRWDLGYLALSVCAGVVTSIGLVMGLPGEPDAVRQVAVAVLAPAGMSAMHFFGIWSGQLYTTLPPPHTSPPSSSDLPMLIITMAVTTYVLSYAMLAHLITQSRNRLAETIFTKRRLWKVIAEKEAFARANMVKSEFIAVASHEIRTPLHAISGYTDLLLQTNLTEEQAIFLEVIRMGCHSIQLITNNVLDFSKLEQDTRESLARPTIVDVRTLAVRILQSCAAPYKMTEERLRRLMAAGPDDMPDVRPPPEKHVDLGLLVDEDVPEFARLDEVYITRVLMNLMSNALKFTEDGYVLLHITIEHPKGSAVPVLAISVRDSGIGIPSASRTAIFEPFTQADSSLTRSHTGAGLGLAISKQLCERMGGTIDLWSKPGVGSEFTVRIPAYATPEEARSSMRSAAEAKQLIHISMAVRSAKKFEWYRTTLEKRGFSLRQIDLMHPARGQQPNLLKTDRVWVDMECFAWAPWLLEHIGRLPHVTRSVGAASVSATVVYDDVGNTADQRVVQALKDHGHVAVFRRPVVLHSILEALRKHHHVAPPSTASTSPVPSVGGPMAAPSSGKSNGLSVRETSSLESLPMVFDDAPSDKIPTTSLRRTSSSAKSDDSATRVLNPLETVMLRAKPPPSERRVRFQGKPYPKDDAGMSTAQAASVSLPSSASSTSAAASTPMQSCILLVEDNIVNQKLGVRLLQKLSYRCDVAENGQVALDMVIAASENKYAVVLMDCQMPVMNGFECTRRIRALESAGGRRARLPIIALTANVSAESREECKQAGADHFLPKPLSLKVLKETLHHFAPVETGEDI